MRKKIYCHFCGHMLVDKHWEGRVRRFCEECNEPIYENPIPAACVILVDAQNRLLLVKRSVPPKQGCWCLPGGFMELGETPQQTALRELKEETGLIGKTSRLLTVDSNANALYNTVALICYVVEEYSGTPIAGDDASDAAFFSKDNLPQIAFDTHDKFVKSYYKIS